MRYQIYNTLYGDISIPVSENFSDVVKLISSDYYRKYEKNLNTWGACKQLLKGNLLAWFRYCQLKSKGSLIKNRIYKCISSKRQIDMPLSVKIGYGFYMGHCRCIIINGATIIGNNVNVSQFLNIGSNKGKAAIINDGVYIAPMVCLVENVTIGYRSIVGAGAVVTKNIPPYCTYAGVPANRINNNFAEEWHFINISKLNNLY